MAAQLTDGTNTMDGGPGPTAAPATVPTGVATPPAPKQDPSIVDFLNQNNIPSDKNTRAQIYAGLGLGSTDDYMAGIGTGETNTALLQALRQAPGTVSAIAGGIKAGQAVSSINLKAPAAPASPQQATGGDNGGNPMVYQAPPGAKDASAAIPGATPAVPAGGATPADMAMKPGETQAQYNARMAAFNNPPGNTLPGDGSNTLPGGTSDINDFQKAFLDSYNKNSSAATADQAAVDAATTPLTADQLLAQANHIQDATGYTQDQQRYSSLIAAKDSIHNDLLSEIHNTGGIVTKSQMAEMEASRTQALDPQIQALATDMATKKALVDTIMQETQTSRQDAANKAEQLLALHNGNANAALDQAASFYKTKVQVDNQQMADKINIALKYGLDPSGTDFMNSSLSDIARQAMPKAQSITELSALSKQIQMDTLNSKLQALENANNQNGALAGTIMSSTPAAGAALFYSLPPASQTKLMGALSTLGYNVGDLVKNNPVFASQQSSVTDSSGTNHPYLDLTNIPTAQQPQALSWAAANNIPVMDKANAAKMNAIAVSQQNLASIKDQVSKMLPTSWLGRIFGGPGNTLQQRLQSSDQIGAFNSWRTAIINNVQALAGGAGSGLRINEAEIEAAMKNDLPEITDTVGVANQKIANLQSQMDQWTNRLAPAKTNVVSTVLRDSQTGEVKSFANLSDAALKKAQAAGWTPVTQ